MDLIVNPDALWALLFWYVVSAFAMAIVDGAVGYERTLNSRWSGTWHNAANQVVGAVSFFLVLYALGIVQFPGP